MNQSFSFRTFLGLVTGVMLLSTSALAQFITTVAGSDTQGDGGPATATFLRTPEGVAVDAQGNLYIADQYSNRVRKVTPNGTITTVAGTGGFGSGGDGGPATSASLAYPYGIVVDHLGNLYISETEANRIRKVDTNGIISTVAGNGTWAYRGDGGPATQSSLAYPTGLAVDGTGNLFIADRENHRIRKVDTNGIITTVAGTGTAAFSGDGGSATQASLYSPNGVAMDGQGNLLIADQENGRIRKVAPSGIITTVAGNGGIRYNGDGMEATQASLYYPNDVTVDKLGNLFISDWSNRRIRKVTATGNIISTIAGTGTAGFSGDGDLAIHANIDLPGGIAIKDDGTIFFADKLNYRIRQITPVGYIITVAGNGSPWFYGGDGGPADQATLYRPAGVVVDKQGNLFFADQANHRIRKVTSTGTISTIAGNGKASYSGDGGAATGASLNFPAGLALDAQGNLFIADQENHRIRKIAPNGIITTIAGYGVKGFNGDGGPAINARLSQPVGVVVDKQGNLFIVDQGNHRIRKITRSGFISTVGGNGLAGFRGNDGPAVNARLSQPGGISIDSQDNLFIADLGNHRIRKIDSNGIITTVAGDGNSGFNGDGKAAIQASLHTPRGVLVDQQGNLLISDSNNHRVRKVTPDGIITTIAGNGTAGFSGDQGPATAAHLNSSSGLALDQYNNLYIVDQGNSRIRKITAITMTSIADFRLINADTDQEIGLLSQGDTLNLATLPTRNLNIRANTDPAIVSLVILELSGRQNRSRTEEESPYALFGDRNGNYNPWTPTLGSYSLTATPYENGVAGTPLTITFRVMEGIAGFGLIDADNNHELKELKDGDQVNLASLPTRQLNIWAYGGPIPFRKVVMVLSGRQSHTQVETTAPYALFGDTQGDYHPWMPIAGEYQLTATPYFSGADSVGPARTIRFSVLDEFVAARKGYDTNPETPVLCYPNPFNDSFIIQLKEPQPVVIYDTSGRIILQLEATAGLQQVSLPNSYASGLYVLQIGRGKQASRLRLIKVK